MLSNLSPAFWFSTHHLPNPKYTHLMKTHENKMCITHFSVKPGEEKINEVNVFVADDSLKMTSINSLRGIYDEDFAV